MRNGNALSKVRVIAIGGQRGTGRKKFLTEFQQCLACEFTGLRILYLGSPFKRLPHPLLRSAKEKRRPPTSRLLGLWSELDEFCLLKLLPAIKSGDYDLIVIDEFGLSASLQSTALSSDRKRNAMARGMHHDLVRSRLKREGVSPPEYIIIRSSPSIVDRSALQRVPRLAKISRKKRLAFIRYEDREIDRYFRGTGQKRLITLCASMSHHEKCRLTAEALRKNLHR